MLSTFVRPKRRRRAASCIVNDMVIAIAKGMVIAMTISMSFLSMASMAKNGTGEQAAHDVEAHDEKEAHASASDRTKHEAAEEAPRDKAAAAVEAAQHEAA